MSRDIPPLPQYAFIAWCLVQAQGQIYFYIFKIRGLRASLLVGEDEENEMTIMIHFTVPVLVWIY
jgi:hypothetical protein